MVHIRAAKPGDLQAILHLGASVSEFAVNKDETVSFWPEKTLRRALHSESVLILVAEKERDIVGFIITNYNEGLRKAIIENIYLLREHRGMGIADQLLDRLLDDLEKRKCEYIAALIPPEARGAAELYTRAGFSKGETFLWLDKSLTDEFKRP